MDLRGGRGPVPAQKYGFSHILKIYICKFLKYEFFVGVARILCRGNPYCVTLGATDLPVVYTL